MNQNAEEKKFPAFAYFGEGVWKENWPYSYKTVDDNIYVEKEPIKPLYSIYWMSWLDYFGVWVQKNPLK